MFQNFKLPRNRTKYSTTIEALARKGNESKKVQEPHSCCLCEKKFSHRESLKKHIESFHCKVKRFCDLCPKVSFSREDIRKHIDDNHRTKDFVCDFCEFKSSNKQRFANHKLKHVEKVECSVCNKPVSNLKCHMLTHLPKLSFPMCKKFVTKAKMKNHILTHSRRVYINNKCKYEKVKCTLCDETFDRKLQLRM